VQCFLSWSWVLAVIGRLVIDWVGQMEALGEVMVVFVSYLNFIIFIFLGFCSFEIIGSWYFCGTGWVMLDVSSNFKGGQMTAT